MESRMNLYVGRPNVPESGTFLARAKSILKGKRLSNNGPMVKELEALLAGYLGVRHVITVCNATVGLMVAIKALGLTGEVILPSFTFVASAHVLQWEGIKPVFCDIDPRTHNIDAKKAESLITCKTTAIMGVHIWGRPCPHDELLAMSHKHGLKLLYDAAHAFGTTYKARPVAKLEDISVLSFHATKCFNTFEGGAIVTDDDELARKARLMCNYSFEGEDNVTGLGINAKMSEIQAAMGLCNLERHPEVLAHNKEVYEYYKERLSGIDGITLIDYPVDENNNYHYIIVEVDEGVFGHSRDELHSHLKANGVLARRYFYPGCHKSEPYRGMYPGLSLPHTDALCEKVLALPGGSGIDELGQMDGIISLLQSVETAGENSPL
jgi:dTDP-4-amino-4,6-dideoxygalactose transaminase